MAEALPPEVERLASFGRALEGTVDKLANKLSPLEGERVRAHSLLKRVRFVQTKFDEERIISIFR